MDKDLFGVAAIVLAFLLGIAAIGLASASIDRAAIAAGLVQRADASGKVIWVKP